MKLLEAIARHRRCAIVSHYANLGIALSINLAGYLASRGFRVQLSIEYSTPIDIAAVIDELYGSTATEKVYIGSDRIEGLDAYIYATDRDGSSILWRGRVYAAIPKLGKLPMKVRESIEVFKTRRVDANTYSFISSNGIHLIKIERYRILDLEIPEEIEMLYREIRDLYTEFGAIKAFDIVKMLRKKYGYTRDQAIQLIRKAIAIGILRYEGGYLIPYE